MTNNTTTTLHPASDPDGVSGLVSFKWLKDQRMLREDKRPQCEATEVELLNVDIDDRYTLDRCQNCGLCTKDLVPDFAEPDVDTASLPSFSHDGVFVHEQLFYRPGTYCVDGVEDTTHSLGSGHAAYYRLPEKYIFSC